jgi:DNA mismatch repair protein MutL
MEGEMHIIDQHAAHERLYFEQFLKDLNEGKIYSQMMLVPHTVNLTDIEFNRVIENLDFFKKVGFIIEEFGANAIIVREVPETLVDANLNDLMLDLVEIVSRTDGKMHTDKEVEALHTMACKRAIKGNRTLTMAEMEKLVSDVLNLENINTCPHGRPIDIKMTKKELEKNFKRIV